MKILAYIVAWCIVAGPCSPAVGSPSSPNESDARKGLGPDSATLEPCTLGNRKLILNGSPNLRVTTLTKVIGGMPDMETPQTRVSLEFAIAPVREVRPLLDEAVTVSSDENGEFEIELAPGRYWIGPKGRAVDRDRYDPGNSEIQAILVNVEAGRITEVDLVRVGYAP